MVKRKASIGTPGEAVAAADPSIDEMAREEHRQYLLQSAGATTSDEIPPRSIRKPKPSSKKSQGRDSVHVDAAKTPTTPRSAATKKAKVTPKKAKASPKRKAADEPIEDNKVALDEEEESETSPKPKKIKLTAKKRRQSVSTATEDSPNSQKTAPSKHDSAADPQTPRPKIPKTTSKTRIPADAGTPQKHTTKPTPSHHPNPSPASPPAPPPQRAHLTPILAAKVQQLHNFITTTTFPEESSSLLTHDPANKSHIHVPLRNLHGALMCLRVDYGVGPAMEAHLVVTDMGEKAIVDRYYASLKDSGEEEEEEWVVIDTDVVSEIEARIQEKIHGWGLEDVRLVEIELEILERRRRGGMGEEETTRRGGGWGEVQQKEMEGFWAAVLLAEAGRVETPERGEMFEEGGRVWGVCPAAPVVVV